MAQPRKKLIEVALPLAMINQATAEEKVISTGIPANLHTWWSRKPLAACRAVLFAQLVDDPSDCLDEFPSEELQNAERQRLLRLLEQLVKHENLNNATTLHEAQVEIARSAARSKGVQLVQSLTQAEVIEALQRYVPAFLDPFCGGGSIPLEAQRLGLKAYASDLNPVAVLINKVQLELVPQFAGRAPINPSSGQTLLKQEWHGTQGLAEDIRYYGAWMQEQAEKRIGHLYPTVTLPKEYGGGQEPVIAWIWARTVHCPNPVCGARMPLVSKFWVSTHQKNEAWVEPIVDQAAKTVQFTIRTGQGSPSAGTIDQSGARCLVCGEHASFEHISLEGQAGRMGYQMMAIVTQGPRGRLYLPPDESHIHIAASEQPSWAPETDLPAQALGFRIQRYGITKHKDLFTPRQLIALTTFSDLIPHVYEEVLLNSQGDRAYANMIATFLAFSISRFVQTNSTLVRWYVRKSGTSKGIPSLDRQIVSMVWEFSEGNVFGSSVGSWLLALKNPLLALKALPEVAIPGIAVQQDAASHLPIEGSLVASLDPPYFNNVGYADLSDFYYVWLRKALSNIYPDLFTTLLVPKKEELIAAPHMFDGNRSKGEQHFLEGLRNAFRLLRKQAHPDYPLTIYYAFKQAEEEEDANEQGQGIGVSSTGWETMLEALLEAGFTVSGTWPMRTEKISRLRAVGSNALASSIVLVCRPRAVDASHTSRGEFLRSLKRELPEALKKLQHGSIAPVDLAQAAIGPGMGVFSRSGKVLEADGSTMRVRTALQLINQTLDEVLAEQEGEYDVETRWAIAWFEQYGMEEGPYGVAETLSKAKNTAVERLVENGMLSARAGKVRLLRREEISETWNPAHQERLTVWEVTQRLIRALDRGGEEGAAAILARTGTLGELARDLAYRLYSTCERNDWAQEALAYNSLVAEWRGIAGQAAPRLGIEQAALFE